MHFCIFERRKIMITIITAHPWSGSFNQSILERVIQNLEKKNQEFQLIELYKERFDPVLNEFDLKLFSKGGYTDPQVKEYQEKLKISDALVFIFPLWWGDTPAILKGFLDKVMLKNNMYFDGKRGIQGGLTNIKRVNVITTSNSPKWFVRMFDGNGVQGLFINKNLKNLGMKKIKWIHCGNTKATEKEKKKRIMFLKALDRTIFLTGDV